MKAMRGYKFRLYPTRDQEDTFQKYAGACRVIYNLALEQRRDHHRQYRSKTGKHISFVSQSAELTALRASVDWLREVTQTCQQQALRDLDRAFRDYFSGKSAYPSFRKKGENDSFRFQGREVNWRRLNKSWAIARLPKIGEVRFRLTRNIPGVVKNVTITLDPLGWHVSFCTEIEVGASTAPEEAVGIDRGISEPLAYSDGRICEFPKASIRSLDAAARGVSKRISACQKGSKRRAAAKKKLAKLRAKMARIRSHFNHTETSRVAKRYGVVCIERLNVKGMTGSAKGTVENPGVNVSQKAGLNRSILEIGWSQFQQYLKYKIDAAGGDLRLVDPAYTSQTCSCCGIIEKTNRKSQAVYECAECGLEINADTNAAINILRAGTRPAKDEAQVSIQRKSHLEVNGLAA